MKDSGALLIDCALARNSPLIRKGLAYALQAPRGMAKLTAGAVDYGRRPPIVVNSIPKSGTHLLLSIVRSWSKVRYFGSFLAQHPTVGMAPRRQSEIEFHLSRIVPGEAIGAHLHHTAATEAALSRMKAIMLFIYRDPRDIALSEAHYLAVSNIWHAMHPQFARLDGEARVRLAITGVDPYRFPDIRRRILPYAGWLNSPAALCISYEALMGPQRAQEFDRLLDLYGRRYGEIENRAEALEAMEAATSPLKSHTFRTGKISQWRQSMSPANKALFRSIGRDLPEIFGYPGN